ncbi:MAG: class I SAM-dependent methyltransferase [Dongiaceae bacterium]
MSTRASLPCCHGAGEDISVHPIRSTSLSITPKRPFMRRETTNFIRGILEDWLPANVWDSPLFHVLMRLKMGRHIDYMADFKRRAVFLTPREYRDMYAAHPRQHENTDLSVACIERIKPRVLGPLVCDVGCGTGYLVRTLAAHPPLKECHFTGVDFVVEQGMKSDERIKFLQLNVERMPFADKEFDTVICTHVIEHILDIRGVVAELRRITRRRLILVVPREREFAYSFNPHFHFFPYQHSFLRVMIPVPAKHQIEAVGRDIFYIEDYD